jgi:hypothetical protein
VKWNLLPMLQEAQRLLADRSVGLQGDILLCCWDNFNSIQHVKSSWHVNCQDKPDIFWRLLMQTSQQITLPLRPRLLDQMRDTIRRKHYSLRTEKSYIHWIKRFIYFHGQSCVS